MLICNLIKRDWSVSNNQEWIVVSRPRSVPSTCSCSCSAKGGVVLLYSCSLFTFFFLLGKSAVLPLFIQRTVDKRPNTWRCKLNVYLILSEFVNLLWSCDKATSFTKRILWGSGFSSHSHVPFFTSRSALSPAFV